MPLVNLDALIPREVLEVETDAQLTPAQYRPSLAIGELAANELTYSVLRKPDFQRATGDWSPEMVADLIQSFVTEELIPSIILWRSPGGNLFVIDGAHRLSAFMAWVHDDYGDGALSKTFFQDRITQPQKDAAHKARTLIEGAVGSYAALKAAGLNHHSATERAVLGRKMASNPISLQWVIGSPSKAATSFFKINQKAVAIDETELGMIECRRKPNGIASRALITAGSGHKYWSAYAPSVQLEIESVAEQVNSSLFTPIYEIPIKTLDLPVAGHAYSPENKKLVWDLVNYVNDVKPDMWRDQPQDKRKPSAGHSQITRLDDDPDGHATLEVLKRVRRIAARISGQEKGSLGLHPNVYFWSSTGKVQPTAVLGAVAFIRELDERREFISFTDARFRFEEFLLQYRHFVNQIARNYGSGTRGLKALVSMYRIMLDSIKKEADDSTIVSAIQTHPSLKFITKISDDDKSAGKNFSRETKSAVYIREALQKALRCSECNARLHFKSITVDHDVRKQDGGLGDVDNGLLTHPYCNTGYKEAKHSRALKERCRSDDANG